MLYQELVKTYGTERLKVLSVWSMFRDEDMAVRPHPEDARGRSVREQMVHQCVSEDFWFRTMLGIDVDAPPLPTPETRVGFLRQYAHDSRNRREALGAKPSDWWEEVVPFFDVPRSRAWIVVRRIAHTAHHRGQQTALLRVLGREVYSTYGPTADTGGLFQNDAPTIYAYSDEESLLAGEAAGGDKGPLPDPGPQPVTERPNGRGSDPGG